MTWQRKVMYTIGVFLAGWAIGSLITFIAYLAP